MGSICKGSGVKRLSWPWGRTGDARLWQQRLWAHQFCYTHRSTAFPLHNKTFTAISKSISFSVQICGMAGVHQHVLISSRETCILLPKDIGEKYYIHRARSGFSNGKVKQTVPITVAYRTYIYLCRPIFIVLTLFHMLILRETIMLGWKFVPQSDNNKNALTKITCANSLLVLC